MDNLKNQIRNILSRCSNGEYRITIKGRKLNSNGDEEDFFHDIRLDLDMYLFYAALGIDWRILSKLITLRERLNQSNTLGRDHLAEKDYADTIEALGTELSKYENYPEYSVKEFEKTECFLEIINDLAEEVQEIIEEEKLFNVSLS